MITTGKSRINVYNGLTEANCKKVIMRAPGRVTHPYWYLIKENQTSEYESVIPGSVSSAMVQKWTENGMSADWITNAISRLRARPVYQVLGRGGKAALFVGPVGAQGASAPPNHQWFRDMFKRPLSQSQRWLQKLVAPGRYSLPAGAPYPIEDHRVSTHIDELKWYTGPDVRLGRLSSVPGETTLVPGSGVFNRMRNKAPFMTGYRMDITDGAANNLDVNNIHTVYYPAYGSTAPGTSYHRYYVVGNGNAFIELFPLDQPGYTSAPSGGTKPPAAPQTLWQHSPWFFKSPTSTQRTDGVTGLHAKYPWYFDPARAYPASESNDVEYFAVEALLAAQPLLQPFMDFCSDASRKNRAGSVFPFPIMGRRIGWALGLPHETTCFVYEIGGSSLDSLGQIIADCDYAYADITGAAYKQMYPVSTLPAAARAEVEERLNELPNDYPFRVVYSAAGFKYPEGMRYDETTLARDISKAGEELDAITFDDPDPGRPAVGYGSLGARSEAAISRGSNRLLAFALIPEDYDFVDLGPIVFKKTTGVAVATRGGLEIDAGDATIAIRSGASYTFEGVTNDEVAQQLFSLATWAAYLATFAEGSERHWYRVDENICLTDGTLVGTPDETARALPLVLGFDRQAFAGAVASGLRGLKLDGTVAVVQEGTDGGS